MTTKAHLRCVQRGWIIVKRLSLLFSILCLTNEIHYTLIRNILHENFQSDIA